MTKTKFKNHKKHWSNMAKQWEMYTEPGRPSRDDIRNFNKLLSKALKGKDAPEILVLGSTPEVRDLLHKFSLLFNAKITCIDMTKDMYNAMSELVYSKNKKEKFILSNWVDIKFRNKFNVVMGDYVNCNISAEHKEKYYTGIQLALKKNGYFITRDTAVNKNDKTESVKSIFNDYLNRVKKEEITIKQSATWIFDRLLLASWFKGVKNKASLSFLESEILGIGKELNKKNSQGKNFLMKEIYNNFIDIWWPTKDKYWTFYLKKDNEKMLEKYFKIEETLYSKDYDMVVANASPIYLLKKEKIR